jgi:hypothetical protein
MNHSEAVVMEVVVKVVVVVVVVVVVTQGLVFLVLTEQNQIPVNICKAACGITYFQTQNTR